MKIAKILLLISLAFLFTSARIYKLYPDFELKVTPLASTDTLYRNAQFVFAVDNNVSYDQTRYYYEFIWNTGDTGQYVQVDTPGVYIVSIKGYMPISGNEISHHKNGFHLFYKGQHDSIISDTLKYACSDNLFYCDELGSDTLENKYIKNYVLNDTLYSIFKNKGYFGFYSGKLDTITVKSVNSPIKIGPEMINIDGRKLVTKKWWLE